MGSVYRTAEGNLVLYAQEERVYLRTLVKEGMGRAVVLASDYASDLTDVLYRGTVYYAYKNTEGEILIRNISDHGIWYRLGEEGCLEGYGPKLCVVGDHLTLLYAVKNLLNGRYHLRCRIPEESEQESRCNKILEQMGIVATEPPKVKTVNCKKGTLMVWDSQTMLWWDEAGNGTRIMGSREELDQKDRLIESIKQQYEELMQVAESYRQEAIKWRGKFHS